MALSNAVPGEFGEARYQARDGRYTSKTDGLQGTIMGNCEGNGGFHKKIICKWRFPWENPLQTEVFLGKSWEIVGKIWENPWVLKGKINYTYISLFEEFEHCLKKYLLQSISPIVG